MKFIIFLLLSLSLFTLSAQEKVSIKSSGALTLKDNQWTPQKVGLVQLTTSTNAWIIKLAK